MLLLQISGCVFKPQLVIYPIKKTDWCAKGDPDCDMSKMDYGMSDFYYHKVLDLKDAKK